MKEFYLLGSKVTAMTEDELFSEMDVVIERGHKEFFLNTNVHGLQMENRHPWLRDLRNETRIVHIDGAGILVGAKMLGIDPGPRVCINDFFWPMVDRCVAKGHRIYMLGGAPETQARATEVVSERAPTVLAGSHHGYFNKSGEENDAMIAEINRVKPNLLLVGFGMPYQERWVRDNLDQLDVNVVMAVGGFFDRLSGSVAFAPRWVTDNHLEWVYLSLHRPSRFFNRYLIENPSFLFRVLMSRIRGNGHGGKVSTEVT